MQNREESLCCRMGVAGGRAGIQKRLNSWGRKEAGSKQKEERPTTPF